MDHVDEGVRKEKGGSAGPQPHAGTAKASTVWGLLQQNKSLVDQLASLKQRQEGLRVEKEEKEEKAALKKQAAAKEEEERAQYAAAAAAAKEIEDADECEWVDESGSLSTLPEDVLSLIVRRLDAKAICALAQTCRYFREYERGHTCRVECWPAICAEEWSCETPHPSLVPCLERGKAVQAVG